MSGTGGTAGSDGGTAGSVAGSAGAGGASAPVASFTFTNSGSNATITTLTGSGAVSQEYNSPETAMYFTDDTNTARHLTIDLWSSGTTIMVGSFTVSSYDAAGDAWISYFEGTPQQVLQWNATSGSVTIDTVSGKEFTFTVHSVVMAADGEIGPAMGTFTLDGTGTGLLP